MQARTHGRIWCLSGTLDVMRAAVSLILAVAAASLALTAQQLPHSSRSADPAVDLARVRLVMSIGSTGLDVIVSTAVLASARFTVLSGDQAVRTSTSENALHVASVPAGQRADVQADLVLASVRGG